MLLYKVPDLGIIVKHGCGIYKNILEKCPEDSYIFCFFLLMSSVWEANRVKVTQ